MAWASATNVVPELCVPGGNPVMDVPGESPTSPATTEDPVLVIVLPASTANGEAVARFTVAVAARATPGAKRARLSVEVTPKAAARPKRAEEWRRPIRRRSTPRGPRMRTFR